ncbi:MAG: hypothetical protein ACI8TF_001682 [Paracoccaceae bacterium]|jgi:hypothetical protein
MDAPDFVRARDRQFPSRIYIDYELLRAFSARYHQAFDLPDETPTLSIIEIVRKTAPLDQLNISPALAP